MIGCQQPKPFEEQDSFTESDSLQVLPILLDSLEAEFRQQWFIKLNQGEVTWEAPNYFPELRLELDDSAFFQNVRTNEKRILYQIKDFYQLNRINPSEKQLQTYSYLKRKTISNSIENLEKDQLELSKLDGIPEEVLAYRMEQIEIEKSKLSFLNQLSSDSVLIPKINSGINLHCENHTEEGHAKVLNSIFLGIYDVRERDCMYFFKESYARIFYRAWHQKDSLSIKRIQLLKIIHPVQLIDNKNCRYCPQISIPPIPIENE